MPGGNPSDVPRPPLAACSGLNVFCTATQSTVDVTPVTCTGTNFHWVEDLPGRATDSQRRQTPLVFPGQTAWFTTAISMGLPTGGYDYDCSGVTEMEKTPAVENGICGLQRRRHRRRGSAASKQSTTCPDTEVVACAPRALDLRMHRRQDRLRRHQLQLGGGLHRCHLAGMRRLRLVRRLPPCPAGGGGALSTPDPYE